MKRKADIKNIDIEQLLTLAQSKPGKMKASFTFDKDIYSEFQDECKKADVSMSRVLENFMIMFNKLHSKK